MPSICPHPMCYNIELALQPLSAYLKAMKIWDFTLYKQAFPLNDIVVGHCRHMYHPWCTGVHFMHSLTCADPGCTAMMPLDWLKKFRFAKLDVILFEKAAVGESEHLQVLSIEKRRAVAFAKILVANKRMHPCHIYLLVGMHCKYMLCGLKHYQCIHPMMQQYNRHIIHALEVYCKGHN
jgi:hypothetical protein